MMSYDKCVSIRFARRIAAELGVDPVRRGTARLARQLADFTPAQPHHDDAVRSDARMLLGDGFTLTRDEVAPVTDSPVVTLTDVVPMARWLSFTPAGVAAIEDFEILGPME